MTITATKAVDTSTVGSFITLFDRNHNNVIVKVEEYASVGPTANFVTDTAYANLTISTGDFFIIEVTAEDVTTVNYYKVYVTVTSASSGSRGSGRSSPATQPPPGTSQNTIVVVSGEEQNLGKETQKTENEKSTVTVAIYSTEICLINLTIPVMETVYYLKSCVWIVPV